VGLTHSTLPPGMWIQICIPMRYIEFCFFCNGAFISNVAAEFIVSYTYEYQKKVVGLDTHCLCNQSVHKKMCNQMVMETALIFLLFNGEDGSRCGVWCGSWYQGSMCIVQCAAIWMDTILENYT